MARFIFPEWTQTFRKWALLLLGGAPIYLVALVMCGANANTLRVGYQPEQPVPYSHALHVGELGLDCRYCHNTVEDAAVAAIPPAATCMNCHRMIRTDSPKLTPVREAFANKKPIKWIKVHDLPDYVYFNHSAHVTRGIGCESCHGRVDLMTQIYQAKPLTMEWCTDCHHDPSTARRPEEDITVMGWHGENAKVGYPLTLPEREKAGLNPKNSILMNCSTCHR
ncbi:MAG TPA: cytochrome c3 family protein [Kofleriaceae bacterium]|nr:cytochrome c3 family protein [Kofleriaceae bacterium]